MGKDLTLKQYLKIQPMNDLIDIGLQPFKTKLVQCRTPIPYLNAVDKKYGMMLGPPMNRYWDGIALVHFYVGKGYGERKGAKQATKH